MLWLLGCHPLDPDVDGVLPLLALGTDTGGTVVTDGVPEPLARVHDPVTPGVPPPGPTGLTVVIGGGVAGLAAAMDIDGPVLLLEASDQLGGRALWAGGRMLFVGNEEQIDAGAPSDPLALIADWPELTGAPVEPVAARFLTESDAVHDRLYELGLRFELTEPDPVFSRWRGVGVIGGGPRLVDLLVGNLPGTVEVHLGTPATSLLLDRGRVIGVDTEFGAVAADRVVIASGGFVNRAEVVERVIESFPGAWAVGEDDGARGWAFDQAEALGLGIAVPEAIGFNSAVVGVAGADGRPITLDGTDAIWVDASGRRFVDETAWWSLVPWGRARARDNPWALTTFEDLAGSVDAADAPYLDAAMASGVDLRCASDDTALAARLGVDPVGLAGTRASVDAARASGDADGFGRPSFPSAEGTPCGYRVGRLASKNFGGLAVDDDGRVIGEDGQVVVGLWAVGEAAGMARPGLGGMSGFDGSLSAVVWGGWRAARAMNEGR